MGIVTDPNQDRIGSSKLLRFVDKLIPQALYICGSKARLMDCLSWSNGMLRGTFFVTSGLTFTITMPWSERPGKIDIVHEGGVGCEKEV